MEVEWRRKRERRHHFKEKMSLEEAHHHRRPWINTGGKRKIDEDSILGVSELERFYRMTMIDDRRLNDQEAEEWASRLAG